MTLGLLIYKVGLGKKNTLNWRGQKVDFGFGCNLQIFMLHLDKTKVFACLEDRGRDLLQMQINHTEMKF